MSKMFNSDLREWVLAVLGREMTAEEEMTVYQLTTKTADAARLPPCRLPSIEIVADDILRQGRAISLNRLCNMRDWEPGGELSTIMRELNESICIHRKPWEYAICICGLKKLGRVRADSVGLSVGAGYERPLYYFANCTALMVATDLYNHPEHEGKPEMLTTPELFAPFDYRRDHLHVMQMSGDGLGFPADTFDFVFSLSSIEHFGTRDAIRKSFDEMVRVTRPDGIICIITDSERYQRQRILFTDGNQRDLPL